MVQWLFLYNMVCADIWPDDLHKWIFNANMIFSLQNKLFDDHEDVRQEALKVLGLALAQCKDVHCLLYACSQVDR